MPHSLGKEDVISAFSRGKALARQTIKTPPPEAGSETAPPKPEPLTFTIMPRNMRGRSFYLFDESPLHNLDYLDFYLKHQ